MSDSGSLFQDAYRKLVAGTEVLRTGGGASLTVGECNAIIDRISDIENAARAVLNYDSRPSRVTLSNLRSVLNDWCEDVPPRGRDEIGL